MLEFTQKSGQDTDSSPHSENSSLHELGCATNPVEVSHTTTVNGNDDSMTKPKARAEGRSKSEITLTDQTNLLPFKRVLAVFGGLSLCALVSCLDSTIVATALPKISAEFNAGSVASWVPSAYLLTSTAFQPLCKPWFYFTRVSTYDARLARRSLQ